VSKERLRVFFALWPAPDLQGSLARWGRAMQRELGGRLTRTETIHLTLAFVGEVDSDRLDKLRGIGESVKGVAFDISIDRCGCWQHNGVAWAGSETTPPSLSALVRDLREKLRDEGFPVEERGFATHITLLRKAARGPLKWQPPEALVWVVESFALVRSVLSAEGSTYSELARWPLQG
jgi:2'-5' RNA ligase